MWSVFLPCRLRDQVCRVTRSPDFRSFRQQLSCRSASPGPSLPSQRRDIGQEAKPKAKAIAIGIATAIAQRVLQGREMRLLWVLARSPSNRSLPVVSRKIAA